MSRQDPAHSPWQTVFERAVAMSDGQIRFVGLASMVVGLLLLALWA